MGLFKRRSSPEPPVPAPDPDVDDTAESQEFVKAVQRGNLDEASELVDRRLALGELPDAPSSLLDRASAIRHALRQGRLDDAAGMLDAWDVPFGSLSTGNMLSIEQRGRLGALGLSLIGYFEHPGSDGHPRYDDLMDGKLASVAKSARFSGDPFYDSLYAQIKSQRELSRHR